MPILRCLHRHFALAGLALFALSWVVARACLQSVVIDEADSYLLFGTGQWSGAWFPSSGNHVLNTILFRLAIQAFGLHEWTLRLPAMLGASVYICSAAYLCERLTRNLLLQVTLFVCLVFNPLVMDYLVAARGYSLAIGFFLAAIALLSDQTVLNLPRTVTASVLLGLSFCGNFSFAIADAVTMLLFVILFVRRWRLIPACLLPGVVVSLGICGWTLLRYPKGELHFGSTSIWEMCQGLASGSFYELNSKLRPLLSFIPLVVPALALALTVAQLASARRNRFAWFLASVIATTLLLHWVAFRTLNILLPKDRTALFFVPLFTLCLGAGVAAASNRTLRIASLAVLSLSATYFVGCLRLTYFKEWKYNADARNVYWIANDLNRRCGIKDPFVEWHYTGSLNFYRAMYNDHVLPHLASGFPPLPLNRQAYVYWFFDGVIFAQKQGLKVIYVDRDSLASVAIQTCEGDKL